MTLNSIYPSGIVTHVGYVETNSSWYKDERSACRLLERLKSKGLNTLLIFISPFHLESIPFSKAENVMAACSKTGIQIFPWMDTFRPVHDKKSIENILNENKNACSGHLLDTSHFHIDLYGNYIPGLCSGISLEMNALGNSLTIDRYPVIGTLLEKGITGLHETDVDAGFKPSRESYISKCDICTDMFFPDFRNWNEGIGWTLMVLGEGDAIPLPTLLEFGKPWSFTVFYTPKERLISIVQTTEDILQHLGVHGLEPRAFLFESHRLVLLLIIGNCCPIFLICFNPFSQIPIIQMSAHGKLVFQCVFLGLGWVDAIFERLPGQQFHGHLPWFSTYFFTSSSFTCPTDARKYDGDQNLSFQSTFFTSGNSFLIIREVTDFKLLINFDNVTDGFEAKSMWMWSISVSCSIIFTSNFRAISFTSDFNLCDIVSVKTLRRYFTQKTRWN